MHEEKIKAILEKKLTLLAGLEGQMKKQIKAVEESDVSSLTKVLDAKEKMIESLVNDDGELEKYVEGLDKKSRMVIAKNLSELGAQIETETEKITEMENQCETKLMNERMELLEKMKSFKNGRILLKGYGMSTRTKPKIKGSI